MTLFQRWDQFTMFVFAGIGTSSRKVETRHSTEE
jgi:hypothetical protein